MRYFTSIILCFFSLVLFSQDFVSMNGNMIQLNNGSVVREICFENNTFYSSRMSMAEAGKNYILKSREFAFLADDNPVDGFSGWELVTTESISDDRSGKGVKIVLRGKNQLATLQVEVNYMLYPELPLVRKWLRLVNKGSVDLKIEAVNVEDLETDFSYVHSVILHNYSRMKQIGSFTGNWHDPVVVLHHQTERIGMAVGNEAPGVLKRTAYHTVYNNLEAGLTHPGQDYPFRKWLAPKEAWESPKTFICLYEKTDDGFAVIDGDVNDFVRKHMYPQIVHRKDKPVFVYNTWNPFRTFVTDSLVRDVAKAAAECGIKEFIIDDGWQVNSNAATSRDAWGNNYGDWNVDEEKFPGGFKPTFDYLRSLGMKPGIWMSIGSATDDAKVYREHPEWFVKNSSNQPGNLHSQGDDDFHTSCFGTDWVDYIKDVIASMWNQYGLAYAKLDFAIVTSAYVTDPSISGCYATDHPYHRDHHESLMVIYERLLRLFDQLHTECPDLFIDCTFETAGKLQLMDYAIANHAEGNWLSNFEEPSPTGPLRIRQMAWWRSPALPASSLVIGNTPMDDPGFEFALKSLIGTLPIVLGDPRKIPAEERARIRKWSHWMQEMQDTYDYMSYRRDLPGFGEPREGAWDGWMRINNDTRTGGIIGVFRQGALEDRRRVFVKGLDPEQIYHVRLAPEGDDLLSAPGSELMGKGFQVVIPNLYDGIIYEIAME
ncbi:MAG: alpha-galactosidase [Bacteroidota bacterium]